MSGCIGCGQCLLVFFFSSRRPPKRWVQVTGVQECALPISPPPPPPPPLRQTHLLPTEDLCHASSPQSRWTCLIPFQMVRERRNNNKQLSVLILRDTPRNKQSERRWLLQPQPAAAPAVAAPACCSPCLRGRPRRAGGKCCEKAVAASFLMCSYHHYLFCEGEGSIELWVITVGSVSLSGFV